MVACYGPASTARSVIQNVNRMHARVKGERLLRATWQKHGRMRARGERGSRARGRA